MAKLASLVVDLQLQSAQLRQGLDEANRKLDAFAKQAESAGSIIAGAFAFDQLRDGLTRLALFVKGGADATVAMSNMAKAAGTPVEEFSKLAYAAERFGFESDNLAESFGQLAEYMAEAKGGSAEHVALFKALGISVTDARGNLRSTGDVFKDLAQRFSETQDGAAKTALAVKFFGEEGIKLIPTLNLGRDGLAKFGEEAARTGRVVTADGVAGTERFSKSLKMLEGAAQGLAASVAQDLAPSLAAFAEEVTTSKASTEAFETVATALGTALRVLASAGVAVATTFDVVGKAAAGAAAWTTALFDDDAMGSQSGEAGTAALEAITDALKAEGRQFRAIWSKEGPGAAMAKDAEKAKPSADAMVDAIERQKKAAEKAAEAQKNLAAETKRAMEASAKALADLERQLAAIDREAGKRRADANGADPTEGFAGLEDALQKWEQARKDAALMRALAGEMERTGTPGSRSAAKTSLAEADALDALADRAATAADAFKAATDSIRPFIRQVSEATTTLALSGMREMEEAIRRVAGVTTQMALDAGQRQAEAAARRDAAGGELAGMLAPSGPALNATIQGAQTGAAAGPVGAVAGAVVGLLSQSESFQGALEQLEAIFQTLADSVGLLVEPLMPLLVVVSEVAAGLGALFEALSPVVEFVARPLFEVFRGFGVVVLGLVKFIGDIINGLGQLFGFENSLDMSGIGKAMERLENASYDSAREQQKVANAARATTESIANVPSWWSVEMARFNAAEPGRPGAGGGGTVVNDNSKNTVEVNGVTDVEEVAARVADWLDERKNRGSGSKYGKEDW